MEGTGPGGKKGRKNTHYKLNYLLTGLIYKVGSLYERALRFGEETGII